MWYDYGGLVAPTAAIINGFIAVVVAQFFKDHPVAKLILVIAAGILSAGAITATFYTQHQIVADREAADARRITIREQLGTFVAEGDGLMLLRQDQKKLVPLQETSDWANRVELFLKSQLGCRTSIGLGMPQELRRSSATDAAMCHTKMFGHEFIFGF